MNKVIQPIPEDEHDPVAAAIERINRQPGPSEQAKVEQAAKEAAWENERKGAYALLQILTKRLGGDVRAITVNRQEWMALPPDEHLDLSISKQGHATLSIRKR